MNRRALNAKSRRSAFSPRAASRRRERTSKAVTHAAEPTPAFRPIDPHCQQGAPETCDGVDEDCDGADDFDQDEDGVTGDDDCDDTDPDVVDPCPEDTGDSGGAGGGDDTGAGGGGLGDCGCSTTDRAGALLGLLGALGLAARRRVRG